VTYGRARHYNINNSEGRNNLKSDASKQQKTVKFPIQAEGQDFSTT
jgi:hypothetical protein